MSVKRARPPVPREHAEQAAVLDWFTNYATVRWPWLRLRDGRPAIYAVPNGGARGKRTAAILQREGVSAGVPDLCVPGLRLRVEMKRIRGGRVSDAQEVWADYLRGVGYHVAFCAGAAEAIKVINLCAMAEERRRTDSAKEG
jgi:VRR-NUC domain